MTAPRSCFPGTATRDPALRTGEKSLHLTGNERYVWLNNAVCAVAGEVRCRKGGESFEVVFDVAELIWEPVD
jgi:hypothetical protein